MKENLFLIYLSQKKKKNPHRFAYRCRRHTRLHLREIGPQHFGPRRIDPERCCCHVTATTGASLRRRRRRPSSLLLGRFRLRRPGLMAAVVVVVMVVVMVVVVVVREILGFASCRDVCHPCLSLYASHG
jgi:hypothetical protein